MASNLELSRSFISGQKSQSWKSLNLNKLSVWFDQVSQKSGFGKVFLNLSELQRTGILVQQLVVEAETNRNCLFIVESLENFSADRTLLEHWLSEASSNRIF